MRERYPEDRDARRLSIRERWRWRGIVRRLDGLGDVEKYYITQSQTEAVGGRESMDWPRRVVLVGVVTAVGALAWSCGSSNNLPREREQPSPAVTPDYRSPNGLNDDSLPLLPVPHSVATSIQPIVTHGKSH